MVNVNVQISDSTIKEIENYYENCNYETIEIVINSILDRYLNVEYFGELVIENSDYTLCESCGEIAKHYRIIDVDGKNLVESNVCKNCGSGYPERS